MRKIFVIAVIAILLSISLAGGVVLNRPSIVGWNEADLVSPSMNTLNHPAVSFPGPLTTRAHESSWILEWSLSEIYAVYGAWLGSH